MLEAETATNQIQPGTDHAPMITEANNGKCKACFIDTTREIYGTYMFRLTYRWKRMVESRPPYHLYRKQSNWAETFPLQPTTPPAQALASAQISLAEQIGQEQ